MTKSALLKIVLICSGLFLLFLNIFGLFIPLRSPYIGALLNEKADISPEKLFFEIDKISIDTTGDLQNLNKIIDNAMVFYWDDNGADRLNLTIPIYENYLLFIITKIYPVFEKKYPFNKFDSPFKKYEFSDYKKGLIRGLGLCSQHAIVLSGILDEKNIENKIVDIGGHVIVLATIDKKNYMALDPTFGVILDSDYYDLIRNKNFSFILNQYLKYGLDANGAEYYTQMYITKDDNIEYESIAAYHGKERFYKYYMEETLYLLKWLIPAALLAFALYKRKRKLI